MELLTLEGSSAARLTQSQLAAMWKDYFVFTVRWPSACAMHGMAACGPHPPAAPPEASTPARARAGCSPQGAHSCPLPLPQVVRDPYERAVSAYHWLLRSTLAPACAAEVRRSGDWSVGCG